MKNLFRGQLQESTTRVMVSLVLFGSVTGLVACSQSPQINQRINAPTSDLQTGYLVKGVSSEELTKLQKQFPKMEVRTLHLSTGFYEIYNVSSDDLQRNLGTSKQIEKNFVISRDENLAQAPSTDMVEKLNALKKCLSDSRSATSVKMAVNRSGLENNPILDLNDSTMEASVDPSFEKVAGNGPAKYNWIYFPPSYSDQKVELSNTAKFSVKPDVPGAYQLVLVVEGADKKCAVDALSFGITVNTEFAGSSPSTPLTPDEIKAFKQLDVLSAPEAWKLTQGSGSIIAVIDSGVNYNHPDLRENIWINKNEVAGNGVDDDRNGYVDDVYGWDFTGSENRPLDDGSHGTHVAGIAASRTFGVAPQAQIMPLKVFNALGKTDLGSIVGAIAYAADNGAKVANMSLGGSSRNPTVIKMFLDAVEYAAGKGTTVVAAAGNGNPKTGLGMNNDEVPVLPASLGTANLIAVASVGFDGELASYSNFGPKSVHVAGPGGSDKGKIVSASFLPAKARFLKMMGTSMASPAIAGVVALLKSVNPSLAPEKMREVLVATSVKRPSLDGKLVAGGIVQAGEAVKKAAELVQQPEPLAPPAVPLLSQNTNSVFKLHNR